MKIGLDFDGVISDCGQLKSEGAKLLYGIEIPPEKFKKELLVNTGILTAQQYKAVQMQVYGTREIGLTMQPVNGVLEFAPKLQKEGFELIIITSRGKSESEVAQEWMKQKGLEITLLGIGGGVSKADACKGLDAYIDDDLDKLEPLVGTVPHRYLFSWGYNQHIQVPESVAKRIESWKHFYEEISCLKKRRDSIH